ncbi:hypothetical protein LAZ67_X001160 [Cordylochernes scorpioides]|uniref:Transposase Tc1-like domain-containing protein n=1 Tax=Cordylochernes scorpioides TaxID=51811 RepID=A0ABY6LSN0_9ARAC|nr:hypothetical protein LAZ67_X001160 [Cordylochernes scorpioides]
MPGHRKRRQFKQTDAFTRGMVIGLKRAGWSIRQITADTNLGASKVHRLWRRWLEQGNVAIYRNVGATRVTSARVDRRILRQAVAAPQATCTAILHHVQDTLDHSISTRTISRRLVANGLHSCRPLRRLPLTPPNRRQRLEWCRARSTWNGTGSCSQMSRVSACPVIVAVYACGVDVEKGPIQQQLWNAPPCDNGTMTAQRNVYDVLRPVTLPYLQGVPNALYQQDNARPHTARISQRALQDDIIGRRLHALPQPRSEDELWQMVEREWRAIPQDAIRTLIDSLPRRVAACIAVRDEAQTASYMIAQLIARKKKAHAEAEEIILPALKIVAGCMLTNDAMEKVTKIPLSSKTIARRIEDMSEDIELQIKQSFNDSSTKWAIQLDETTDISNKAQLLAFFRFVDTEKIVNNYFFCKELKQRTTGADIFELVDENVMKYNLRWENCVRVCTDGAPAMKVFKRLFTEKELSEFWLCLNSKFPKLSNAAIESLLPFGSSYLCEQGFSTLTEMKSKKRERLQMIDEEMRVCLSQVDPRIDLICSQKQSQCSH